MGLDMYAVTRTGRLPAAVDFAETPDDTRLHYWRKHPNLHGWMEQLYRDKHGSEAEFNCVSVALTLEDIDRLEGDIRTGNLPPTGGFFFGASDGTEHDDDLVFIAKARDALRSGASIYYTSWW